jgi:hypothetical protein
MAHTNAVVSNFNSGLGFGSRRVVGADKTSAFGDFT